MNRLVKLLTAAGAALAVLLVGVACSQTESAEQKSSGGATASGEQPPKLLWVGDSVAAQLAKPLQAAAQASGVPFKSIASAGGGNVSGIDKLAKSTFDSVNKVLGSYQPDVVIYQVSTYDWGTAKEQRGAYEKFLEAVAGTGAKLVFVPMPPIKPDDFYAEHMDELNRTTRLVNEVAAASKGKATVLDSAQVWGQSFQLRVDGKLYRKSDGIHTCPQGAAKFTAWLMDELAERFPGITPAEPKSWANAGWAGSAEFNGC